MSCSACHSRALLHVVRCRVGSDSGDKTYGLRFWYSWGVEYCLMQLFTTGLSSVDKCAFDHGCSRRQRVPAKCNSVCVLGGEMAM